MLYLHLQGTRRVNHHGLLQFALRKQVSDRPTRNTEERRPGKSIQKAGDDKRLNVLGHRARYNKDEKEGR